MIFTLRSCITSFFITWSFFLLRRALLAHWWLILIIIVIVILHRSHGNFPTTSSTATIVLLNIKFHFNISVVLHSLLPFRARLPAHREVFPLIFKNSFAVRSIFLLRWILKRYICVWDLPFFITVIIFFIFFEFSWTFFNFIFWKIFLHWFVSFFKFTMNSVDWVTRTSIFLFPVERQIFFIFVYSLDEIQSCHYNQNYHTQNKSSRTCIYIFVRMSGKMIMT